MEYVIFLKKFQTVKSKNNITNEFSLTFHELLLGEEFLNDYIIFIKHLTDRIIEEQLAMRVLDEIEFMSKI